MLHSDPFYGSGESLIYCSTSSAAPQLRAVNEPAQRLLTQDENSTSGQVPKGVISVTRSPREREGGGTLVVVGGGLSLKSSSLRFPSTGMCLRCCGCEAALGSADNWGGKKRRESKTVTSEVVLV